MSQVIDWEYYSSHFPSIIPNAMFDAVESQAEVEFNKVVHPYMLHDISEECQKNTIFKLSNFLYVNKEVMAGKAVTSVNNNGYSESYAIQTIDQAKDAMRDLIYDSIGTRLAGAF